MRTAWTTIFLFTLGESLRGRLLYVSLFLLLTGFVLAEFAGALTLTEHRQTQVALLAGFLRLAAVVLGSLLVVSGAVREMQDRMLEMIVALDVSRATYLLAKFTAYAVLVAAISLLFSLLLLLYAPWPSVMMWGASLWLEMCMVCALCLVMMFSFAQITSALAAVMVFYLASRVIAVLVAMATRPVLAHTSLADRFVDGFILGLSWLLPDLSAFTQTQWLLYDGVAFAAMWPLAAQSLVYVSLLLSVALFDFYRKNL